MRNQTAAISARIDASDGPRHAQLPVEKFTARSLGTEMTKSKRDHGNPRPQFAYRFPDRVVVPQLVEERRKPDDLLERIAGQGNGRSKAWTRQTERQGHNDVGQELTVDIQSRQIC